MEADGVFAEMAADSFGRRQPALTVQLYNPSYDKDRFENTALTIEGRIAALKLVYAGAYLVRNVEQVQDYTSYAHNALYVDYYQCVNPGPTLAEAQCFTPSSTWRDVERNIHLTQELRLSTPADWRIRAVGGLFYEDYRIQDQGDWFYLTALPYFTPVGPPTGYFTLNGKVICGCGVAGAVFHPGAPTSINPNVRPLGDAFFNDITRGYGQKAAYMSVDIDLLPHELTLTAGTRYYSSNTSEVGSLVGSFDCQLVSRPPNPCVDHSNFTNLDAQGLTRAYSGLRSRANLSWKASEDALLYYTWSQGFRAGGFNRSFRTPADSPLSQGSGWWQAQASIHGSWSPPVAYEPDTLISNELGWKTMWLGHSVQWNGAIYQEAWNHAQVGAFDARVLGGATINGGNYRVRGLETSAEAREGALILEAGVAWNHSELVKEAALLWADGMPIDFNSLQTSLRQKLANPAGTIGSSLAGAPTFQGNVRARYEFAFDAYRAFAQIGLVHESNSLSTTDRLTLDQQGKSVAYDLPSFTSYDAALGVAKDGWLVQVYGENLTDTRAELFANYVQGYKAVTVNRPRTIGLRFSYKIDGR
jgi:outer membrane receptor protein involved in Fe transport